MKESDECHKEMLNLKVVAEGWQKDTQYYVQNIERGFVGDNIIWWRKGGHGYTCNLDDAEIFTIIDLISAYITYYQSIISLF